MKKAIAFWIDDDAEYVGITGVVSLKRGGETYQHHFAEMDKGIRDYFLPQKDYAISVTDYNVERDYKARKKGEEE